MHELAHVFQKADDIRYTDDSGGYQPLLLQSLFQGSKEVMADCYTLMYFDEWTLSDGITESASGTSAATVSVRRSATGRPV
ncbi:hypothetical protein [Pseudoclavibacter sp. VKM Ac-2867]|uniref:hypothetical protein n=1 Tax=Pseudoclavibacter sp. VKM Ac-2867 TaxID=2783829 RepID=UPI00188C7EEF|nr:hypothetical protein [Pseudoclavibacter sp. VKM Ac-2867]MBF4458131.1 hypothetical protein [Pseudoclavibacter sp. VKM Ac-2867]